MSLPQVLLVHGVNSTGEWHDTTQRECHGLFQCVPVKYRYFHGLTGPIKVYAWPTGLLLLAAMATIVLTPSPATRLTSLLTLLVVATVIVAWAEWEWSRRLRVALLPVAYLAAGASAALLLESQLQFILPIGILVALSAYLDFREYGHPGTTVKQAIVRSLVVFVLTVGAVTLWLDGMDVVRNRVTLLVIAAVTALEPWWRRSRAMKSVKQQFEHARGDNPQMPHVVAHSLGTYLTGHLLNENENLLFGRIIFTGCVLDRSFPWHRNLGPGVRPKCWAVKNYVGRLDLVPLLTGFLRLVWVTLTCWARFRPVARYTEWLGDVTGWRPLGSAGLRGFRNRERSVHSQSRDIACQICSTAQPTGDVASVHNVTIRFSGHSTLNQDPDYQSIRWLPFLFGDNPDSFDMWKEVCRLGNDAREKLEAAIKLLPNGVLFDAKVLEHQNDLNVAKKMLLTGKWYWPLSQFERRSPCPGRDLQTYVSEICSNMPPGVTPPRVELILDQIPVLIFEKVAMALRERLQKEPRHEVMSLLEPCVAVRAAVVEAIHALQREGMPT